MSWTVYVSWRAHGQVPAMESCEVHENWPDARSRARQYVCLAGVRYVTLQGPGDVVVGDYDRYTNTWREYTFPLGPCRNEREPDGEICTGQLRTRIGAVQVKCPVCGGWEGVLSRPEWRIGLLA